MPVKKNSNYYNLFIWVYNTNSRLYCQLLGQRSFKWYFFFCSSNSVIRSKTICVRCFVNQISRYTIFFFLSSACINGFSILNRIIFEMQRRVFFFCFSHFFFDFIFLIQFLCPGVYTIAIYWFTYDETHTCTLPILYVWFMYWKLHYFSNRRFIHAV